MKKSLIVLTALFVSHSAFAYEIVERRFSVEGPRAKALYEALAADHRADVTDDIIVEMDEGIECKGDENSCVTFNNDGDEKVLRNSVAIFAALKAAGANLSLPLNVVHCSRGYTAHRPTENYFCKVTEQVSIKYPSN